MKEDLKTYVYTHLKSELDIVQRDFSTVLPALLDEYKTLIYKYTDEDDAYNILINKLLRTEHGLIIPIFAQFLTSALKELSNHRDVVYRGAFLTKRDIERYENALETATEITEHSFLSASLSKGIAETYGNVLFKIFGKTCKLIENISKFGSQSVDNEREVLFQRDTSFKILDISKQGHYTIITLREV